MFWYKFLSTYQLLLARASHCEYDIFMCWEIKMPSKCHIALCFWLNRVLINLSLLQQVNYQTFCDSKGGIMSVQCYNWSQCTKNQISKAITSQRGIVNPYFLDVGWTLSEKVSIWVWDTNSSVYKRTQWNNLANYRKYTASFRFCRIIEWL